MIKRQTFRPLSLDIAFCCEFEMDDLHKPFAHRPRKESLSAIIERIVLVSQGCGNCFEVGGGGQTSPGFQGNPCPKLKTPRIWPTIFCETKVHVQKQIKIKMNDIDSPKLGGGALQSCPHCPRLPRPCGKWFEANAPQSRAVLDL